MAFKKGDMVLCVEGGVFVAQNEIYEVTKDEYWGPGGLFIMVKDSPHGHFARRFIPVYASITEDQIKELI